MVIAQKVKHGMYTQKCYFLSKKLGMRQEGLFQEFVSFVNDADGNPIYENTMQWAILKKEWGAKALGVSDV